MKIIAAPTMVFEIFVSGPRADIERECASYCLNVGACVSVEPTRFIYTGGIENGMVVRILNYPKFPKTEEELQKQAMFLANLLITATHQHSALVVGPTETIWITKRENNPESQT